MQMKCPVCGGVELVSDVRDMSYTYKGEMTLVINVAGDYCPNCNESVLSADESRRVMELMLAFNNKVNASLG